MDVQFDVKKNVPETIKAINNTYDINQITYYENQLACMLTSPLMFLSTMICFLHLIIIRTDHNNDLIINMVIFFLLGNSQGMV